MITQDLFKTIDNGDIGKLTLTKRITIDGESDIYPVYKIPVNMLYYNDQNGRINTAYYQFIANNERLTPELGDSLYNSKFEEFIYDSDPKTLKDTQDSIKANGQQEPGVVLPDGRVIDGNRRLTAIRRNQRQSGDTGYFEAAILAFNINDKVEERKIKQLELDLQLGREERKSYDPIDRIFDVYNTIEVQKLLNEEEYRKASGARNTRKIKRDLRLASLIIRFLDIVSPGGKPDEKFYLARELKLDGPIEEIEGTISKLKDGERNQITDAVLTTLAVELANSSNGKGDTTRKIRDIKTNILKNPDVKKHYLDATDENVDKVIDYFEDNPIEKSQDLKHQIEQNAEVSDAANKLVQSTNRLSRKGENDSTRRHSLSQLIDIRDNLSEMNSDDFEELKPDEVIEVKSVLKEIRDLIFKLEHGE